MPIVSFLRRLLAERALWGVAGVTATLVSGAGLVVWRLEPDRFDSALSGIWWAASTVTTVGYGDLVPETEAGRAVGLALMFSGAALFAAVAAIVAAVIVVGEVAEEEEEIEEKEEEILALLAEVNTRLARLELRLASTSALESPRPE